MPPGTSYALFRTLNRASKPTVFADIGAMARSIHRERGGSAIQLHPGHVAVQGFGKVRMVGVYRLGPDANQESFLGWAYLAGAGRAALEAALRAHQPNPAAAAEVA